MNLAYYSHWESWRNIMAFSIAYAIAGIIGLEMQSAQTGVTPFWPASGVAMFAFISFGLLLWPGILIGMLILAISVGFPLWVGVYSAIGSVLEAVVPLYIAQRMGFKGNINALKPLLLFIGIALVGPLFSASIGTFTLFLAQSGLHIPLQNVFLTWWLGNSFGMLLVGAGLLLLNDSYQKSSWEFARHPALLAITVISIIISVLAFQSMHEGIISPLILNLIIPVVLISTVFLGFSGTLVPVSIACITMLVMSPQFPFTAMNQHPLGMLYLNIVSLWIITMTGLLVSAAYREGMRNIKTQWLATHDGLTSLYNRHYLESSLNKLSHGMRQKDKQFCLQFLDLNNFTYVNDEAGHLAGDAGLKHVATILRETTRESDIVARWGGDEFVILLPDCPMETSRSIAENINEALNKKPFIFNGRTFPLSFSIGIATQQNGESPQDIIGRANQASYVAKNANKHIILAEKPA